ncbi:hypothetical protein [Polymorphobacter sp.]|uniref:hypothetical protein n=1 Tax=Polymorphobacter sp. TaxID=1909290 RepID=UPI003F70065C
MTRADEILEIVRAGQGERPASLENQETEDVLTITLALLVELGVALDRIDRLERQVAELAGKTPEQLREAPLGADAEIQREAQQTALIARALRIFFDGRTPVTRGYYNTNRKGK